MKTRKTLAVAALLFAAASSQAAPITSFQNIDFDLNTQNVVGGFDNTAVYDVPYWNDLNATVTDAGSESGAWWPTVDNYAAFMASGDGAYNISSNTIQSTDVYNVNFYGMHWEWTGTGEWTVTLFYDNPTNVIGSFTQGGLPNNGSYNYYKGPAIAATPASVGHTLGILFKSTGTGIAQVDEISVNRYPFVIGVSPTGTFSETNQTIEATITNINSSTFVSATLSLDGAVVDSDNTAGTSHTLSYTTGLSIGVHTSEVVAVSSTESMTNTWTFEISQPPFGTITTSPTGWVTNDTPTLQAVIVEDFEQVSSAEFFVDDASQGTGALSGTHPTNTATLVSSALAEGVHTGKIVITGSGGASVTNEWTFSVLIDDATHPTSLVHWWKFDENGGTNVADSVGSSDGSIYGSNYTWSADGLSLGGQGSSGDWNAFATNGIQPTAGAYVDLPNGTLSGSVSSRVTIEAVYSLKDVDNWQNVWCFGRSDGGENISDTGSEDIFLTPHNGNTGGARMEVSTASPGYSHVNTRVTDPTASVTGQLYYVVATYDASSLRSKLYVNGVLVAADLNVVSIYDLSLLPDINCWFGRSQYNDPMFAGKLYDIKVSTGIITSAEVDANYATLIGGGGPTLEPHITLFNPAAGQVVFDTESGFTYHVLGKSALTDPVWATNDTVSGTGSSATGTVSTAGSAGFFKVEGN